MSQNPQAPVILPLSVYAHSLVPHEDQLAEIIRRGLDLIEALPPKERERIARSVIDTPPGSEPDA